MALIDSALVEREIVGQLTLNGGAALVGTVGQAPDAKGSARMKVFGGADERRIGRRLPGTLSHSRLTREGTLRHQREHRRACDAVGRGHPLLHILVGGVEVVGYVIVVAQVHGPGFGSPEVGGQVSHIVRGAIDLQRGGEALPEVLDADAQAAADVADEGIAVGTAAGVRTNPHIIIVGPFLYGVALVGELREAISVPARPVV